MASRRKRRVNRPGPSLSRTSGKLVHQAFPASAIPPEDWSRRGFYQTMLRGFLHRDQAGPPEKSAPFFLQTSLRRLTQAQYEAARDQYVVARRNEYLDRAKARMPPKITEPEADRWPDPLRGEEPGTVTPAQKALGQLYFAEARATQAKARAALKGLATRGRNAARTALAAAVAATPQAKATFSTEELLFGLHRRRQEGGKVVFEKLRPGVIEYRANRQFMWHFLRAELLAAIRLKRKKQGVDWTLRDLLTDPGDFEDEIRGVLNAYRFLGLSKDGLLHGLRSDHQADVETARHFDLSPKTLRSLFSRAFSSRPI